MLENLAIRKIIYSGKSTGFTKTEKRLDVKLENFDSLSLKDSINTSIEFYTRILWLYGQILGVKRGKAKPPLMVQQRICFHHFSEI